MPGEDSPPTSAADNPPAFCFVSTSRELPVIALAGSTEEMGRQHATQAGELIRAAVPVRWRLCLEATAADGNPRPEDEVRDLAQQCWDYHAQALPELTSEVEAMAEAAGVDPLGLLIQNGYTDFRDCLHACATPDTPTPTPPEGCTAFAIGASATRDGVPLIGQTWDMHCSALPYVVLLSLRPKGLPPALMLSLAGCVGMIGMNAAGLAVCTNNLHCRHGQIGIFWPFLMRRMLVCETVAEAREVLMEFPVAGGHNYLFMDASGAVAEIERLPGITRERTPDPVRGWTAHTNHCTDPVLIEQERVDSVVGRASSGERLRQAEEFLDRRTGKIGIEDLMELTALEPPGSLHSVCMRPVPDFDVQTCAALVMAPSRREFHAAWGRPSESLFLPYPIPTP